MATNKKEVDDQLKCIGWSYQTLFNDESNTCRRQLPGLQIIFNFGYIKEVNLWSKNQTYIHLNILPPPENDIGLKTFHRKVVFKGNNRAFAWKLYKLRPLDQ